MVPDQKFVVGLFLNLCFALFARVSYEKLGVLLLIILGARFPSGRAAEAVIVKAATSSPHAKLQLHHSYLIDPPAKEAYDICSGKASWHPASAPRALQRISLRCRCKSFCGLNMGRKYTYATKAQLETLVLRMHRTGILYSEALGEFKKQFILVILRDVNWNQSKAARGLGMHRRTLVRTLRKLSIDIRALRNAERRPPRGTGMQQQKKIAG